MAMSLLNPASRQADFMQDDVHETACQRQQSDLLALSSDILRLILSRLDRDSLTSTAKVTEPWSFRAL